MDFDFLIRRKKLFFSILEIINFDITQSEAVDDRKLILYLILHK